MVFRGSWTCWNIMQSESICICIFLGRTSKGSMTSKRLSIIVKVSLILLIQDNQRFDYSKILIPSSRTSSFSHLRRMRPTRLIDLLNNKISSLNFYSIFLLVIIKKNTSPFSFSVSHPFTQELWSAPRGIPWFYCFLMMSPEKCVTWNTIT